MEYVLTLWCGCVVKVMRDARTKSLRSRVIGERGVRCPHRHHRPGARLWLWEILPDPRVERAASESSES
jgi:hypothetical protein